MIGTVLALRLLTLGTEATLAVREDSPVLTIDSCVEVDESTVREVMELELRDLRARQAPLPASVGVRCVGQAQEIRAVSGDAASEDTRTISLSPIPDDAPPAARQARSRELALAIAELIRRQGSASPPVPGSPPPMPPAPPTVATLAAAPEPSREGLPGRRQLGLVSTFEYFGGGQTLAGGDVAAAARLGHWALVELRAGGRAGAGQPLPAGRLTARAATAGVGVGLVLWPEGHRLGGEIVLRAQGYLVEFRSEEAGGGGSVTAALGAFAVAAEPRLLLAVTRHFALAGATAVGFTPRGIIVRTQGIENQSTSGVLVSASLAGVFTF